MRFYIVSDTHLTSKSNWDCDPYTLPRPIDHLCYRESSQIIKKAFDLIIADKTTDIVFITGDLTNLGDWDSHKEMKYEIERLQANGKRVFAYPAGHDFTTADEYSFRFDKNGKKIPQKKADTKEVFEWYKKTWENDVIAIDDSSYSYIAQLDEKTRLIILIAKDNKDNRLVITDETMNWASHQITQAKSQNMTIFASVHHPILYPSPIYKIIAPHDMIANNDEIAKSLSDAGVDVIFTGHSHMHDIEYKVYENGKTFYDITTGALTGYLPCMRIADYNNKNKILEVKTIYIDDIETELGCCLQEYSYQGFIGFMEKMVYSMGDDINTFAKMAIGMSMKPAKVKKLSWIITPLGKFINHSTFGRIGKWTRKETGFNKKDFADIKDKKIVPYIINCIKCLYTGDADLNPNSKEYAIIMSFIAILDNITDKLPINIKDKLHGNNLKDIVQPLLYNEGICDKEAKIYLDDKAPKREKLKEFTSKKGGKILTILIISIIILSPILIPTSLFFALVISIRNLFIN
ncbi:MAG: metallophosphoesterase [Clostridia bacterium]